MANNKIFFGIILVVFLGVVFVSAYDVYLQTNLINKNSTVSGNLTAYSYNFTDTVYASGWGLLNYTNYTLVSYNGDVSCLNKVLSNSYGRASFYVQGSGLFNEGTNQSILVIPSSKVICSDKTLYCGNSDIDRSGKVDALDFNILLTNWQRDDCGSSNSWCSGADMNYDGYVDAMDYNLLVLNWQHSCNTDYSWVLKSQILI